MAPLLLLIYSMMVVSQSYSLTGFSLGISTLPFAADDMALWFNSTSNEIILIPSQSDGGVLLFNPTDKTFTAHTPTPTSLTGYSFSKTFIGDTLYFNHYLQDNIGTYELATNQYRSPMTRSITTAVDWACLTSDNRYVYVLGGKGATTNREVAYFQVFDSSASGNRWHTGSPLNRARFMSACEIYQGTVYIFGGEYYSAGLNSIEKIDIGKDDAVLSNVATATFQTIGARLNAPKSRMATAKCDNVDESLIYLIGGINAYGGTQYNTVEMFDAGTDTIVKRVSMKRTRMQTSAICANGYIYVFGGYTMDGYLQLDTWEYSNYLTEAPTAVTLPPTEATVSPSAYPSEVPSISPSKQPSVSPTEAPSSASASPTESTTSPTVGPSTSPSYAPTLVTMDPSSGPSVSPSSYPSVSPTSYPSSSPSLDPSVSPTSYPSSSPSSDPSSSPSSDSTTFIQSESVHESNESKATEIRVMMVSAITVCVAYLLL